MMPADVGRDDVGAPDDGRGQAKPPIQLNTYAVTREPIYMQTFNLLTPFTDYTLNEDKS